MKIEEAKKKIENILNKYYKETGNIIHDIVTVRNFNNQFNYNITIELKELKKAKVSGAVKTGNLEETKIRRSKDGASIIRREMRRMTKPVKVKFKTKQGEKVLFDATEITTKPVKVKFGKLSHKTGTVKR